MPRSLLRRDREVRPERRQRVAHQDHAPVEEDGCAAARVVDFGDEGVGRGGEQGREGGGHAWEGGCEVLVEDGGVGEAGGDGVGVEVARGVG